MRDGDEIIGIAPLMTRDGTALLVGDTDVCDYLDFIVKPGREQEFFTAVLDDVKKDGIVRLDLKHVRPDSTVLTSLALLAQAGGMAVDTVQDSVSYEMDLPSTFDAYLEQLSTKQRHEVRRKLRRLNEEGAVAFRFAGEGAGGADAFNVFFRMFVESRRDKAEFMTEQMGSFFRLLSDAMSKLGLLKLGMLALDGRPLAAVMCFDYRGGIYLYNSGYDPDYVSLSAGLLTRSWRLKPASKADGRSSIFSRARRFTNSTWGAGPCPCPGLSSRYSASWKRGGRQFGRR